jgi:hypothetical protein
MASYGTPIEVRVKNISQLFEALDPFPFPRRDLDNAVEEFIVGWARELPVRQSLEILFHLPSPEAQTQEALRLPEVIERYFTYRADVISGELKELFHIGRRALGIGLTVLVSCFLLSQFLGSYLGDSTISRIIVESLIIVGWVANWKPIQIFLYDWWPLARRRSLYSRLAAAKVELRPY